jgi:hypothetical protein
VVCWALAAIAQTTIPPISTTQNSQRQGDRAMGVPGLIAAIRSGRGRCSWLSGPDRRNKAVRFARQRVGNLGGYSLRANDDAANYIFLYGRIGSGPAERRLCTSPRSRELAGHSTIGLQVEVIWTLPRTESLMVSE